MKIGIITFHRADNYGAVLQAFGLYKKIQELFVHNEVYIVDYCPEKIKEYYRLLSFKNIFNFISSAIRLPFNIKRKVKFNKFRKEKFKYIDIKDIHCLDFLVCGSDQIWNPNITGGIDLHYFGHITGFTGKIIAYAASDGGCLENIDTDILEKYLLNFSAISVREPSMLPFLKQNNDDISVVLDPVFLFDMEFWKKITYQIKKKYILIYRMANDEKVEQDAYLLAKQKGLRIIEISYGFSFRKILKNEHRIITTAGIHDFLSYILHAEYIFTNSFHGTAFSIIFNKDFYTYRLNNKKNNRIHTILSWFNITDRYGDNFNIKEQNKINYLIVNNLVTKRRNESLYFLEKNIS